MSSTNRTKKIYWVSKSRCFIINYVEPRTPQRQTSKAEMQLEIRVRRYLHHPPYLIRLSVDTVSFNIWKDCLICGKDHVRSESVTSITTGTGKNTTHKVLHAAGEQVQLWTPAYQDHFTFDAKYHRRCLAHYVSDKNVAKAKWKCLND